MKYQDIRKVAKYKDKRHIQSCWIAERKRKNGFKVKKAHNAQTPRKIKCPEWAKNILDKILCKK